MELFLLQGGVVQTSMKKFEHGGDINSFAKELNCDIKQIIDLSSNINFIKPKIDFDFTSLDISSYPDYKKNYIKQ